MGRISITQISANATSRRTSKSRRFGLNIVFKFSFVFEPQLLPEALFARHYVGPLCSCRVYCPASVFAFQAPKAIWPPTSVTRTRPGNS